MCSPGSGFAVPVSLGDVDLNDYADVEACLVGPGGGLGVDCECFDYDDDGDNDLEDFAAFQNSFTGQ